MGSARSRLWPSKEALPSIGFLDLSSRRPTVSSSSSQPASPTPPQSLPSIHEALGGSHLSFQAANTPAHGPPPPPPPALLEANPRPSELFADPFTSTPHSSSTSIRSDGQRSSVASIHSQDSRNPSIRSLGSARSPLQTARTTLAHDYPYPQVTPGSSAWTSLPPAESRAPSIVPYNEPVKRQLDLALDLQATWNEIADGSAHTLEVSRTQSARIYQANRTEHQSLPTLAEIDHLLQIQRHNLDALTRIRTAVLETEQAMAQQREHMRVVALQKSHPEHAGYGEERAPGYREEFKGGNGSMISSSNGSAGGFAGGDAKKRRGKPAPPGRCHSCSRSETPEWRRGPDGARTLCNACGLHYAKLTRKLGNKAAAQLRSRHVGSPAR